MHLSACRVTFIFPFALFSNYRYRPRFRGETRLRCVARRESFQFSWAVALLTLNQRTLFTSTPAPPRELGRKDSVLRQFSLSRRRISMVGISCSPRENVAPHFRFFSPQESATNTLDVVYAILNALTRCYANI